jgi:SAM-dependent methyltransferase
MQDDYSSVNRDLWNTKTGYHINSSYYNMDEFISNKNCLTLKQRELDLLGNIKDKRILHLQCHFGLDTLSLARLGAKKVVGIDLSDVAIDKACQLAKEVNLNDVAEFICCDIYEIEKYLKMNDENDLFDIVFTSYGTTKWFPDLNKWAHIIEKYLKINGLFIIVDFHPVLWPFDDRFQHLANYSYFNRESSMIRSLETRSCSKVSLSLEDIHISFR